MAQKQLDQVFNVKEIIAGTINYIVSGFLTDCKVRNLSHNTIRIYTKELGYFLQFLDRQGVSSQDELTPDVIRTYLLDLSKSRNPGGIRVSFRVIRTLTLWWEAETDGEYRSPIRKVKQPKVPEQPLEPITRADFDALVSTCDSSWHGARDKAILLTLLDSGVRAQELCDLDLVDLESMGALEVRQGKGRKPRVVFVGSTTRKALRQWVKHRGITAGPLFTTQEGERLTYSGLRQIVRRRAEQVGIDEPGLHDFRRAFCLAQLQAGVNETTIARLMGHTSTQLIARYARQTRGNLRELYYSPIDKCK